MKLQAEFAQAFDLLARNPHVGTRRPYLTSRDFLFWPQAGHWIVYRVRGDIPIIAHVIDARRDVARLLG
jgi:plasmid stabilization system protein ParE